MIGTKWFSRNHDPLLTFGYTNYKKVFNELPKNISQQKYERPLFLEYERYTLEYIEYCKLLSIFRRLN